MISSGMSSKILKEALFQQKEIEDEARDQNPNSSFFAVEEEPAKDEEEDVDDFAGFDDTQSHFGGYEVGLIRQILLLLLRKWLGGWQFYGISVGNDTFRICFQTLYIPGTGGMVPLLCAKITGKEKL